MDGDLAACAGVRLDPQLMFARWKIGDVEGEEPAVEALKLGWAHGALITTFPGDTTMATVEQVRALAKGESARIQR